MGLYDGSLLGRAASLGWLGAALVGCGGGEEVTRGCGPLPALDGPHDVLMISVDTLRRDHVGRYRAGASLTPFLDARMAEAFVLDDLAACSNWTLASAACVLSGASNVDRAAERGMIPAIVPGVGIPAPFSGPADPLGATPFLASWLSEAGYRSALVSGNEFIGPSTGLSQGYDEVTLPKGAAKTIAAEGLRAIEARAGRGRWFAHLHFMDPHMLYTPPPAYLGPARRLESVPYDFSKMADHLDAVADIAQDAVSPAEARAIEDHLRARYEGEIRYLDDTLRDLWRDLDRKGLLDDTLVVFWTDHGEAFWEHGTQAHAKLLYREENDAVGFFWARDLAPRVCDAPVSTIDLTPTTLALLGLDQPPEVSGHPVGEGPDDRVISAMSLANLGAVQSARRGSYKAHFFWGLGEAGPAGLRSPELTLYDLDADPREQEDRSGDPALREELLDLWGAILAEARTFEPFTAVDPRVDGLRIPEGLPGG